MTSPLAPANQRGHSGIGTATIDGGGWVYGKGSTNCGRDWRGASFNGARLPAGEGSGAAGEKPIPDSGWA